MFGSLKGGRIDVGEAVSRKSGLLGSLVSRRTDGLTAGRWELFDFPLAKGPG